MMTIDAYNDEAFPWFQTVRDEAMHLVSAKVISTGGCSVFFSFLVRLPLPASCEMPRPPSLQLQLDNDYEPLRSPAPIQSFYAWLYQFKWRKLVIAVAIFNVLRNFVWASNAFQDVGFDSHQNLPQLARISTALGAMYSTTAIIDAFGVFCASMQRQTLIRVYAHLAFISAMLVTVAGFVAGVSYYVLSDDLIHQCILLCTSGKPRSKSMFNWPISNLTPTEAQSTCLHAWTSESTAHIFSIFLFYVIPSIAYFFLAYTYYRQTTDPTHPGYLTPHPSKGSAIRMGELPEEGHSLLHNNNNNNNNTHSTPYSDDITDALRVRTPKNGKGLGAQMANGDGDGDGKHGGGSWSGKGRRKGAPRLNLSSPVMYTASPYMMSPGPPSFSMGGLSRDFRPAFFRVGSEI